MIRAGIILQARMASSRLPGKAMARLGDEPIVVWCLRRLAARSGLPVVLATTERPDDNVLCEVARRLDVPVERGPVEDVLARFVQAATRHRFNYVIRATADNPLVDLDAPRRTLDQLCRSGAAYLHEPALPVGAAVEAFTTRALRLAHESATDAYDREHVTPFLLRGVGLHSLAAQAPAGLRRRDLRLTVDTAADLDAVRRLVDAMGDRAPLAPLPDVIRALDRLRADDYVAGAASL